MYSPHVLAWRTLASSWRISCLPWTKLKRCHRITRIDIQIIDVTLRTFTFDLYRNNLSSREWMMTQHNFNSTFFPTFPLSIVFIGRHLPFLKLFICNHKSINCISNWILILRENVMFGHFAIKRWFMMALAKIAYH